MKTGNDAVISRRRWLGAAATAASVGSSCSPAQPSPTTTNLLVITIPGARTYNVRDFEPGAMGPRSTAALQKGDRHVSQRSRRNGSCILGHLRYWH